MIFDFPDPDKLWYYKFTTRLYCIIFYEKNNQKNKELYINLTKMLKDFEDLPFLRAEFNAFKQNFPKDNVTSPNQILIFEQDKSIIKEIDDYRKLPKMLQNIRETMIEMRKKVNAYYRKYIVCRTWSPASRCFKISDIIKMKNTDAEILYKFPNITYLGQKLSNIHNEKPTIIPSSIKSETILKKQASIIKSQKLRFEGSLTPKKIKFSLPSINELKKSKLLKAHIVTNLENSLDLRTLKNRQKIPIFPLNDDQPLDLSIPKNLKSSAVQIRHVYDNSYDQKLKNIPYTYNYDIKILNRIKDNSLSSKKLIMDSTKTISSNKLLPENKGRKN